MAAKKHLTSWEEQGTLQGRVSRAGLACWAEVRWGQGVYWGGTGWRQGGLLLVMIELRASGEGREFLLIGSMGLRNETM